MPYAPTIDSNSSLLFAADSATFLPQFRYSRQNYYRRRGDIASPMDARQDSPTKFHVLTPDEAETLAADRRANLSQDRHAGRGGNRRGELHRYRFGRRLCRRWRRCTVKDFASINRYARSKFGARFVDLVDDEQGRRARRLRSRRASAASKRPRNFSKPCAITCWKEFFASRSTAATKT